VAVAALAAEDDRGVGRGLARAIGPRGDDCDCVQSGSVAVTHDYGLYPRRFQESARVSSGPRYLVGDSSRAIVQPIVTPASDLLPARCAFDRFWRCVGEER
jgi:hypothetical protein